MYEIENCSNVYCFPMNLLKEIQNSVSDSNTQTVFHKSSSSSLGQVLRISKRLVFSPVTHLGKKEDKAHF